MKVNLTYDEFVNAVANAGVWVYFCYDPNAETMSGTFTARAMIKGVVLEYMDTQKPATFDTDMSGIALQVQGMAE